MTNTTDANNTANNTGNTINTDTSNTINIIDPAKKIEQFNQDLDIIQSTNDQVVFNLFKDLILEIQVKYTKDNCYSGDSYYIIAYDLLLVIIKSSRLDILEFALKCNLGFACQSGHIRQAISQTKFDMAELVFKGMCHFNVLSINSFTLTNESFLSVDRMTDNYYTYITKMLQFCKKMECLQELKDSVSLAGVLVRMSVRPKLFDIFYNGTNLSVSVEMMALHGKKHRNMFMHPERFVPELIKHLRKTSYYFTEEDLIYIKKYNL